jgi:SdrD B-like protein/FG-GAP repeat protein/VCBS repeat protein
MEGVSTRRNVRRTRSAWIRLFLLATALAFLQSAWRPVFSSSETDKPWPGRNRKAADATQVSPVGTNAPVDGSSAPAPSGWMAQVQQDLAKREYDLSWQETPSVQGLEASWQAPNRAQGFRTYFVAEGIRVVPRTESETSWTWGLSLVGYGRGEKTWEVPKADLNPSGRRIGYRRGTIHEEYENSEMGLEQQFRLSSPPERRAPEEADRSEPIHLDLKLWGSLTPHISEDGLAIQFVTGSGAPAVHYSQLKVTDARGTSLRAWMEGFTGREASGIRILIDAREASYPILVDPIVTTPSWTTFGNQANARFGTAVATAGDVNNDGYSDILVGAPYYDNGQTDEGRVYLYQGSAAGPSTTPSWTAELNQTNANFGYSVATAGDVNGDGYSDVIAGAWLFIGVNSTGRVVVYLGSASGLSTTPAWTMNGSELGSSIGYSVSTAGDVNDDGYSDVIIGDPNLSAAYVYLGSASGLAGSPASTMVKETTGTLSNYGGVVANAGDVNGDGYADVLVADSYYANGESYEGKIYLYVGTPAGVNTTPAWSVEGNSATAYLGSGLATAGDVNGDGYADVIIGARGYTDTLPSQGRAVVYLGSSAGLAATPAWTFNGDQAGAYVGIAVSTAGDVNGDGYADVVVGAYGYSNPETNEGRAYIFPGSASGPVPGWSVESNSANGTLGGAVATAGDVNGDGYADILVGAPYYDGAATDQGAAYLYLGSASGPPLFPGWSVESDQTNAALGWSVASAGDVNGDGFADVIVGAPGYDNGQTNEGRAYVYLGGASGLAASPAWTAEGNENGDGFGISVASAGDVNRDGYSDVIVGAAGYDVDDGSVTGAGRAIVYLGSPFGLAANPVWTALGDQIGALFGISVASAGDVNGDGYFDVVVGAEKYSNGQTSEGRAYLYLGSPLGPSATPAWMAEADLAGAGYGRAVASAGDVNRDGYSDVIVGAYRWNDATVGGRVYLYLGSPSGLATSNVWSDFGYSPSALYGLFVAGAGDVNGDGYSDIIVGAPGLNGAAGAAYLYQGSASGIPELTWFKVAPNFPSFLGWPVGTAGDVNGDGYADVITCEDELPYVYLGSSSGLATAPAWSENQFGCESFASAGDVNGDGVADLVLGSTLGGALGGGSSQVFYGNGGPGLSLNPRQRQQDFFGFHPIAPNGRSFDTTGSFSLQTLGKSPFGRSDVRLEWEIKPLASPLNAASIMVSSSSIDTGTAGANLIESAIGLNPGSYHWRLRLRYDSAKTPLAQRSRWMTIPWHGWQEAHVTLGATLGGWVWDDLDGDGVRENGEPGRGGATVFLVNSSGITVGQTTTIGDGYYRFEVPGAASSYRLQFPLPGGAALTLQNQGDDTLDSDPDPTTGLTALIGPAYTYLDDRRWSAGLACGGAPTLAVVITGTRPVPGTANLILDISDPNPFSHVTGYNVYRASQVQLPPSQWTLLGANVTDNDPSTPNIQWTDTTGDTPALGTVFYYQAAAFNQLCGAEGPR